MSLIPSAQLLIVCWLFAQLSNRPNVMRPEAVRSTTINSEGVEITVDVPKGWYPDNLKNVIRLLSEKPGFQWSHGGFPRNGAIVLIRSSKISVKQTSYSLEDDAVRTQIQSDLGIGKNGKSIGFESRTIIVNNRPQLVNVYEIEHAFRSGNGTEVSFGFVWLMGDRLISLEVAYLRPSPKEKQHIATAEALLASITIRR